MHPPRPTPPGRPGRFVPPELERSINENISKFAINFESFRAKNNEYVGFFGSKSNQGGQRSEQGPNQSDRPSGIDRGDRADRADFRNEGRVATPQLVIQRPPELYLGGNSVSITSNPFEKQEVPLPAVKKLKQPLVNPSSGPHYPSPMQHLPFTSNGLSKPPTNPRDEAIKNLLRYSIIPDQPFDARAVFRDFSHRYHSPNPHPASLAESFSLSPPFQRAKIFREVSSLAAEVEDARVEALLVFVAALGNDFLLLSVLRRLLDRPFLRLSAAQVAQVAENLNRICSSRRIQILLISFINKLD